VRCRHQTVTNADGAETFVWDQLLGCKFDFFHSVMVQVRPTAKLFRIEQPCVLVQRTTAYVLFSFLDGVSDLCEI
jgi:hypothetical protein